jgi:hypothetical protein
VQLVFRLTSDDLSEANSPEHQTGKISKRGKTPWWQRGWLSTTLVPLFVATHVFLQETSPVASVYRHRALGGSLDVASQLGPVLLLASIFLIYPLMLLFASRPHYTNLKPGKRSKTPQIISWTVGASLGIVLLLAVQNGNAWISKLIPMTRGSALAVLYGTVFIAVAAQWILLAAVARRIQARQLSDPLHAGDCTATVDDAGVSFAYTHFDLHFKWSAFAGAIETPNLILLVQLNNERRLLAKRGLQSEQDLYALRNLLHCRFPDAKLRVAQEGFSLDPAPVAGLAHNADRSTTESSLEPQTAN